jgi:hypothetical protein
MSTFELTYIAGRNPSINCTYSIKRFQTPTVEESQLARDQISPQLCMLTSTACKAQLDYRFSLLFDSSTRRSVFVISILARVNANLRNLIGGVTLEKEIQ